MSFNLNSDELSNQSLNFDIKRSIILAEYIKCWGLPENRALLSVDNMLIEVYVFPGEDMDQVSRVATIGLSSCNFSDGKNCNSELLMVLPYDIVDDEVESISNYIFDISNSIINTLGRNLVADELVPQELAPHKITSRVPNGWPTSVLFDEPRAESPELNNFYIGLQHIKLCWVIPIYKSEYDLIKYKGIESFDAAINEAGVSLVEVRRDACV